MIHPLLADAQLSLAIISGSVTLSVAVVGIIGNWYLSIQNKKREIEQREAQTILENLKGFWEYQNALYSETLKVVTQLVMKQEVRSEEFLTAYKRFWELYWCELPACESPEINKAMVALKEPVYKKKHLEPADDAGIREMKESMNHLLLDLAKAVRDSSLLLEYSENIRTKMRSRVRLGR